MRNTGKLVSVRSLMSLILVSALAGVSAGQSGTVRADDGLVRRALENEVRAAQDTQHPMRYRLRKSSPRLTSTKEIFETKDGAVARLVAINDQPLSQTDEERERARLDQLLREPGRQRRRKQAEDQDSARAMKVLRLLPSAFLYQYAGSGNSTTGRVEKFAFRPNPKFSPPDLETQVLTKMTGEIWVDPVHERVTRLVGQLQQDVDIGWGIVARLNRGGWIEIEQADVAGNQWRVVHFRMAMTGRVVFRSKVFDTTEDESRFAPLPPGMGYQRAIEILTAENETANTGGRASTHQ